MKSRRNNNLKKLRKLEKMTQSEIAELLDISVKTYQNYEQGIRLPSLERCKKLADIFNCSIDDIFFDEKHFKMKYYK